MTGFNTKVTPEIENLTQMCVDHSSMDVSLYGKYDVKRGLRDINGKGVLYRPRAWFPNQCRHCQQAW